MENRARADITWALRTLQAARCISSRLPAICWNVSGAGQQTVDLPCRDISHAPGITSLRHACLPLWTLPIDTAAVAVPRVYNIYTCAISLPRQDAYNTENPSPAASAEWEGAMMHLSLAGRGGVLWSRKHMPTELPHPESTMLP